MGGGGSSGGSVVQQTAPWAALQAGQIGVQAANQAADEATKAINSAILSINKQYSQARYDVQPYRTAGVQALDQLNQYMGLDPYNPGNAPTAPKAPNLADFAKAVKSSDIRSYIQDNLSYQDLSGGNTGIKSGFISPVYSGINASSVSNPILPAGALPTTNVDPDPAGLVMASQSGAIRNLLGQQAMDEAQPAYDQSVTDYNQNLAEYNQNLNWYNQYKTAGPLSAQQISDNITNQPGYQAQLNQGIDAITKNAAAKGSLGGGGVLKDLMNYGQNTLSTFYGNELSRLAGIAGMGQQAATTTAGISQGQGNALASLQQSLGDARANAALAAGNAQSQALIAANQQFSVMGGGDSGGGGIGQAVGAISSLASAFSSKEYKNKISTPSTREILAKLDTLSLDKWVYKNLPNQTFIGPYAEEFKELFGVGDGKTINMIDVIGVLLCSVKELSKQVHDLKEHK